MMMKLCKFAHFHIRFFHQDKIQKLPGRGFEPCICTLVFHGMVAQLALRFAKHLLGTTIN